MVKRFRLILACFSVFHKFIQRKLHGVIPHTHRSYQAIQYHCIVLFLVIARIDIMALRAGYLTVPTIMISAKYGAAFRANQ